MTDRITIPPTTKLPGAAQVALLVGPMLSMVDSSIVNVTAPSLMTAFGAAPDAVAWVASAYLLALGAGLAVTPWLASRIGGRRCYGAAMAAFVLASALCALAPTLGLLVAARVLQGLAGAPLVPLAMGALLGDSTQRRDVGAAVGLVLFAAPAFGPALGGLLLQVGDWPLVFLVNLPVGLIGLAAWTRLDDALFTPPTPRRFDLAGLVLLVPGMVLVLWGAESGPREGWAAGPVLLSLGAGLVLVGGFVAHALRTGSPLVRVRALATPAGATVVVLAGAATIAAYATVFVVPLFLQQVQGRSPLETGLALLPPGVLTGVGSAVGDALAKRSVRWTVVGGGAVLTATSLALTAFTATMSLWVAVVVLAGRAAAIGLVTGPLVNELSRRVRPADRDVCVVGGLALQPGRPAEVAPRPEPRGPAR